MVFADVGDTLEIMPAPAWSFQVGGEMAEAIGAGENLVARAARLLFERAGVEPPALQLHLDKALPVAAGLGGGSSDAGAALRLLNATLSEPLPPHQLEAIAAELGADGPACLRARSVLATGIGADLQPAPETPPLPAVLVNPLRPSPTGPVYWAYDAGPAKEADLPSFPGAFPTPKAVASALAATRNDLEPPAIALEPEIAAVLAALDGQPESLLARMSGSGATCFALCADGASADRLAGRLSHSQPGWWVRPCRLGSPL